MSKSHDPVAPKRIRESDHWILFGDGERLFFDVLCNSSFAYYDVAIELDDEEKTRYRDQGDAYLNTLAYEINYSALGVIGSKSVFKDRLLPQEMKKRLLAE